MPAGGGQCDQSSKGKSNMNKGKGIGQLICLAVMIAVFVYAAANGLGSDHSGSIADIKQGLDLAGGVSITYEVVDENPTATEIELRCSYVDLSPQP